MRRLSITTLLFAAIFCQAATAADRPLFASQATFSPGIRAFQMNVETGALSLQPTTTPAGTYPTVPAITPDGSRLYVSDFNANQAHGFSLDSSTTTLTELVTSPYATSPGPNSTVIAPGGTALWTADFGGSAISGFGIGGTLTAAPGSPFAAGSGPNAMAVSPRNNFLFSTDNTGNTLLGYSRGSDGALTPLAGFPLLLPGATPVDPEFSVDGKFLFVADTATNDIHSFAVNQASGSLTEVAGSPFAAGNAPGALAASPDGKWLFVANTGDDAVGGYAVSESGGLTSLGPPTIAVSQPFDITVSPNSRFLYAASYVPGTVSGLAIGADGSFTELPGSPFGDMSGPLISLAIVPDQGPAAALAANLQPNSNTVALDAGGSNDPDGSIASYSWDFGDGSAPVTTTSPQTTHVYRSGTFAPTVTVADNENCSDQQIGTGQTLACNGSAAARAASSVTIPPLALKYPTGKQIKNKKSGNKVTRRVQVQYFLNRPANVSMQFQISKRGGTCKKKVSKRKRPAKFKNYGKKTSAPGVAGLNKRTFTGKFGGKTIVPARYRVLLIGTDAAGDVTGTVTSPSFCVK